MADTPKPPAHYNPSPRFGFVTEEVERERWERDYARFLDEEYERNGWCIDCLEMFSYDDTFGYNPPCSCGLHCRDCHDAEVRAEERWENDEDYDEDYR